MVTIKKKSLITYKNTDKNMFVEEKNVITCSSFTAGNSYLNSSTEAPEL